MLFAIKENKNESLKTNYDKSFDYVYKNIPFKIKTYEEKKKNIFSLKYSSLPEDMLFLYISCCFDYIYDFFYSRLNGKKRYDLIINRKNLYEYYFSYNFFVKNFLRKNAENIGISFVIVENKYFELENRTFEKLNNFFELIENNSIVSFSENHLKNLYIIFIHIEKYLYEYIRINMKKSKKELFE